jgi:sulfite exporter TauE/SafE
VAAQVKKNPDAVYSFKRLTGAALLPYHFGRMTTYIALGMLAALLSKQIIGTPLQQWLSVVFLSLAGLIFIASALPKVRSLVSKFRYSGVAKFGFFLGKVAKPLFSNPRGINGYGMGVLLGFLPCGLVFAALMIVSTTGDLTTAALAMALFTLGTFPALFLIGIGSQFAYQKWPQPMQMVVRGVMIFNGFSLFLLAGTIVL